MVLGSLDHQKEGSVRKHLRMGVLLVLMLQLGAQPAGACTSFVLRNGGEPVFARNFDYGFGGGMLVVNKRSVAKTAAVPGTPAQWVAKYGSVTFNLYGRELPMGGMNEEGLVVECMWLDESQYPAADSRPAVSDLQWIQYQLDVSATVADVIQNAAAVRIFGYGGSKIHFLVSDQGGDCAVIEFIGGKFIAQTGRHLPVPALTNSTYENSVGFLDGFVGDVNSEMYQANSRSLGRFVIAATAVKSFEQEPRKDAVSYAFDALDKARSDENTQWTIVYDVAGRRIHFRTRENPATRVIDFADLDFSCLKPVLVHDLAAPGSGTIAKELEDYTYEKNKTLVTRAFASTGFLENTPAATIEVLSKYPESLTCSEQP
jgi:penicillin V acylase-like amidase (Ntn superfamily)